jgi:hypothetical protein
LQERCKRCRIGCIVDLICGEWHRYVGYRKSNGQWDNAMGAVASAKTTFEI